MRGDSDLRGVIQICEGDSDLRVGDLDLREGDSDL